MRATQAIVDRRYLLYEKPHILDLCGIPYIDRLYGKAYFKVDVRDQALRTNRRLGAELRRYRMKHGLTQAELAALIDRRQATISRMEIEGPGTLETLFAVLCALDLELIVRPRPKREPVKLGDIF